MSDLLGVASNAVAAYQRALSTTSNNIANVSTPGYTREVAHFEANPVTPVGSIFMGTGASVDKITRQYNAFMEANLRNSNSDLSSQAPMVDYANRVVDIMGGQTTGLSGSLDQFFSAARDLSGDPASTVLRSSFLRDAVGVADRFGQLSGQLDSIQEETSQALQGQIEQVNSLTKQLALVNFQLNKQRLSDAQPPGLMDQRDQLLLQISDLARVNTKFEVNGVVTVSLGLSITQDVVVSGNNFTEIGANFNAASPEKVAMVLDPFGKSIALNGPTSGSIAGMMAFREQVLGNSHAALDSLAKTFANAVNDIHQGGIDGYGKPAGALFRFDPAAANLSSGMQVALDDPMRVSAAAQFRVTKNDTNTSAADPTLAYDPTSYSGPVTPGSAPGTRADDVTQLFDNNSNAAAGRLVTVSSQVPVRQIASIAGGLNDVSFFLDSAQIGQQLSILTRDGRAVVGASLTQSAQDAAFAPGNGFVAGATYSDTYSNKSGVPDGYRDMKVFYGAQAEVTPEPLYNDKDQVTGFNALAPVLQGSRIQTGQTSIDAKAFVLNGTELGPLGPGCLASVSVNGALQAKSGTGDVVLDVVSNGSAITVGGQSLAGLQLAVGDQSVTTANDLAALVNGINAKTPLTGVGARLSDTVVGGVTTRKLVLSSTIQASDLAKWINQKTFEQPDVLTSSKIFVNQKSVGDSYSIGLKNTTGGGVTLAGSSTPLTIFKVDGRAITVGTTGWDLSRLAANISDPLTDGISLGGAPFLPQDKNSLTLSVTKNTSGAVMVGGKLLTALSPLTIAGQTIDLPSPITLGKLVDAINAKTNAQTGKTSVAARISPTGDLLLSSQSKVAASISQTPNGPSLDFVTSGDVFINPVTDSVPLEGVVSDSTRAPIALRNKAEGSGIVSLSGDPISTFKVDEREIAVGTNGWDLNRLAANINDPLTDGISLGGQTFLPTGKNSLTLLVTKNTSGAVMVGGKLLTALLPITIAGQTIDLPSPITLGALVDAINAKTNAQTGKTSVAARISPTGDLLLSSQSKVTASISQSYVLPDVLKAGVLVNGSNVAPTDGMNLAIPFVGDATGGGQVTTKLAGVDFSLVTLKIGGKNFNTQGISSLDDFVKHINASTPSTNVVASITNNRLVLSPALATGPFLVLEPKSLTGVLATARNEIRAVQGQMNLNLPLRINNVNIVTVDAAGQHPPIRNLSDLVNTLNANSSDTRVTASVNERGELLLTNAPGHEGEDITLNTTEFGGAAANALGLTSGTYGGTLSLTQPVSDSNSIDPDVLKKPVLINNIAQKVDDLDPRKMSITVKTTDGDNAPTIDGKPVSGMSLSIAGQPINTKDGTTLSGLIAEINRNTAITHVSASVSPKGDLVLTPAVAYKPLQLTFGASGSPHELGALGFRTQATISGVNPDDMLVFVTGSGSASVAASFAGEPADPRASLRAQTLVVNFESATHYTITDTTTGTVVASRNFDPAKLDPAVDYQGLQLKMTSPPAAGDAFTMDGNQDGVGNNDNMIAIAALENKRLIGNKTLNGAYIDHVNEMGNISRQAKTAQTALTVVHDQAVASRDQLSGVSLDAEAADLIRFQQAYQAAAKVIQISGTLFDAIVGIR